MSGAQTGIGRLDQGAETAIGWLASALMLVGGVALMLMMVHVTADVVGKFVFNRPIPMTLEMVSNYYMVAVVFLPFAAVERSSGNIHVELIYAHLPRLAKRLLDAVTYVLFAGLFWFLTTGTWAVAMKKFKVGEFIMGSYPVPIWPTRFLVPLGCGLALALVLVKLLRTLIHIVKPDTDPGDGPGPDSADPIAGTAL